MDRRIVITGLGALTPAGIGADALADAVRAGRSAVRTPARFDASGYPSQVAGEAPEFDLAAGVRKDQTRYLRKNAKVMARDIQMAVAASNQAIVDSGLPIGDEKAKEPPLPTIDRTRIGMVFGTNFIPTELEDLATPIRAASRDGGFSLKGWGSHGIAQMFPLWLLKYLPNMHTCHTGILWDAQGPSNSLTTSDAGGLLALDETVRILRRGAADWMLAGGAESRVNPLLLIRYSLLGRLATANDDPARASRPFDLGRTGQVAAEGAVVFFLERRDIAHKRGARVYGEVLGTGASTTTAGINACDADGRATANAVRAALANAGLQPRDLGAVLAHGAAYEPQDRSEAAGLAAALGEAAGSVPVTATKGVTGNMGAASGLADLAVLMCLKAAEVPPILNCDRPDPAVKLNLVRGKPQPLTKDVVLATTLAIGGQAAAAVIRINR